MALVGTDRIWASYVQAGIASAVWGLVLAALPEPPGWWVLLLALWRAGVLGIVVWTAAQPVRGGTRTFERALSASYIRDTIT